MKLKTSHSHSRAQFGRKFERQTPAFALSTEIMPDNEATTADWNCDFSVIEDTSDTACSLPCEIFHKHPLPAD